MNRRRFVGHVMALAVGGYASGQKEFVGFDVEEVQGCSRIISAHNEDRFFANLRSGRQVEITEKDFKYLFQLKSQRRYT